MTRLGKSRARLICKTASVWLLLKFELASAQRRDISQSQRQKQQVCLQTFLFGARTSGLNICLVDTWGLVVLQGEQKLGCAGRAHTDTHLADREEEREGSRVDLCAIFRAIELRYIPSLLYLWKCLAAWAKNPQCVFHCKGYSHFTVLCVHWMYNNTMCSYYMGVISVLSTSWSLCAPDDITSLIVLHTHWNNIVLSPSSFVC